MLCGVEIYGFGKFEVPVYVKLSGKDYFAGRSSSGKTVFLKCVQFLLDPDDSIESYYISCDKAYVKGYLEFCGKKYWVKKTVINKGRSVKCEVTFDEDIPLKVFKWYEDVCPIYFNNERYYSNKEIELKEVEKRVALEVKDKLLDEMNNVENKITEFLKDITTRTGLEFEFKLDVNKGINISLVYDEYIEYLSTSERKLMLIDVLFKNSFGCFLLLDDLDLYFDSKVLITVQEKLESLGVPFIAIMRNDYNITNGYIDYKFTDDMLSLNEYKQLYGEK